MTGDKKTRILILVLALVAVIAVGGWISMRQELEAARRPPIPVELLGTPGLDGGAR